MLFNYIKYNANLMDGGLNVEKRVIGSTYAIVLFAFVMIFEL